MRRDAVLADAH
jgi:hypothetical protein